MSHIQEEIKRINAELPSTVRLVAVSKYHPVEALQEAYEAGQRIFGESKVQEMTQKYEVLPKDIEWHFIGHLQTNKVKYIAPYVSLIHAVDSERLLAEIDKQASRIGRKIPCLLQLHIAREETKFGFSIEELLNLLDRGAHLAYNSVTISGLMCMASNVDDDDQIAQEFARAHSLFLDIKDRYFKHNTDFAECSWGMSDDYPLAIAHGSTLVRIGSKIFGSRQ